MRNGNTHAQTTTVEHFDEADESSRTVPARPTKETTSVKDAVKDAPMDAPVDAPKDVSKDVSKDSSKSEKSSRGPIPFITTLDSAILTALMNENDRIRLLKTEKVLATTVLSYIKDKKSTNKASVNNTCAAIATAITMPEYVDLNTENHTSFSRLCVYRLAKQFHMYPSHSPKLSSTLSQPQLDGVNALQNVYGDRVIRVFTTKKSVKLPKRMLIDVTKEEVEQEVGRRRSLGIEVMGADTNTTKKNGPADGTNGKVTTTTTTQVGEGGKVGIIAAERADSGATVTVTAATAAVANKTKVGDGGKGESKVAASTTSTTTVAAAAATTAGGGKAQARASVEERESAYNAARARIFQDEEDQTDQYATGSTPVAGEETTLWRNKHADGFDRDFDRHNVRMQQQSAVQYVTKDMYDELVRQQLAAVNLQMQMGQMRQMPQERLPPARHMRQQQNMQQHMQQQQQGGYGAQHYPTPQPSGNYMPPTNFHAGRGRGAGGAQQQFGNYR
jgi:hypothetical protein